MNKKGDFAGIMGDQAIYLILLALFLVVMLGFLWQQQNGAELWEDYYVKEIARVIDLAKPGDEVVLDVHKGTEIAFKNDMRDFSKMFKVDNDKEEVCAWFSSGRGTCFSYFNNVDVVWEVKVAYMGDRNVLILKFYESGGKNA